MQKFHKNDVAPVERENERDENYISDNPQIDRARTKDNYHIISGYGTYTEFINNRLRELSLSPRKDAVVMNSFVVGSDKTFFSGLPKALQYQFFSDCTKFFLRTLRGGKYNFGGRAFGRNHAAHALKSYADYFRRQTLQ